MIGQNFASYVHPEKKEGTILACKMKEKLAVKRLYSIHLGTNCEFYLNQKMPQNTDCRKIRQGKIGLFFPHELTVTFVTFCSLY